MVQRRLLKRASSRNVLNGDTSSEGSVLLNMIEPCAIRCMARCGLMVPNLVKQLCEADLEKRRGAAKLLARLLRHDAVTLSRDDACCLSTQVPPEVIPGLVALLNSMHTEDKVAASWALSKLTAFPDHRAALAATPKVIPSLVGVLCEGHINGQHHAMLTLSNMTRHSEPACDRCCSALLASHGVLPSIIAVLVGGRPESKEWAAWILAGLTKHPADAERRVLLAGTIVPLASVIRTCDEVGAKLAAQKALQHLAIGNEANRAAIAAEGYPHIEQLELPPLPP